MFDLQQKAKFVTFIEASDLFKNCLAAWKAYQDIKGYHEQESAYDKILVKASYIYSALDDWDEDDEDGIIATQIQNVLDRINYTKKLPDGGNIEDFLVNIKN